MKGSGEGIGEVEKSVEVGVADSSEGERFSSSRRTEATERASSSSREGVGFRGTAGRVW